MTTERFTHTATLLQSGKVLIVGGQGYSGCLASAEIYDPTVGAFAAAGTLATARSVHTATLLQDGRVLIVGGFNVFQFNAHLQRFGGGL